MKRPTQLVFYLCILSLMVSCNGPTETPATLPQTIGFTVFAVDVSRTSNEAIDVVFIPDDDYGDMSDTADLQAFLNEVAGVINQGFQMNQVWNFNADEVNYWYMTSTGDVQPGTDTCPSVTWPLLLDVVFAEVIILLHPNELRDCAWGNRVTSEPSSLRTVVHEASHAAFVLPDEYCCDGGYWEAPPVLYTSEADCLNDGANAAWRDCQSFTADNGTDWWRSEDDHCDIMVCADPTVLEYGPADWVIAEQVLSSLPGSSISVPSIFAPSEWP